MAFRNRGEIPNFENNGTYYYRGLASYYHTYIPLDNTYIAILIITSLVIITIGIIAYFITYQTPITDPIEDVKNTFINAEGIVIFLLLVLTLIINSVSKSKEILRKRLLIIFFISIITMLVFLGIKLNLDGTYTEERFEEIYTELGLEESSSQKPTIDIGLGGVDLKTQKQFYIDECVEAYFVFKVRTYALLGLHLLLSFLLLYQIGKVKKIQENREKLNKDDIILFDEEQNVRY